MNKRNLNASSSQLAVSVYIASMREQIEQELEAKYLKRIDYLVGANNELMRELEVCEGEIITVEKETGSIDPSVSEEFRTKGGAMSGVAGSVAKSAAKKKRES
jgi:hypothetical protein